MKLVIIDGRQSKKEYPLQDTKVAIIGRSDKEKGWSPDIDLQPDQQVSRDKVSVWLENDRWWIRDSGSEHGTLVDGREIKGLEEPTRLSPGSLIKMGETILMFDPPKNRLWGCRQGLVVDFDCLPAINYPLHHCRIPAISPVRVSNLGSASSSPFALSFSIPGYSPPSDPIEVPSLKPRANFSQPSIELPFHPGRLEGQEGRSRSWLEVKAGGDILLRKELWVLGLYEYPYEFEYRRTLASFVLHGSPIVVQKIIPDARSYLKKIVGTGDFHDLIQSSPPNHVESILHALYDCLKDYEIRYVLPSPVSEGFNTQVIRPPHRIFFDPRKKEGEGTCIDLTLLMAACLESLGMQPVIVMVKADEGWQHAFLGCWSRIEDRFEPILSDPEQVNRAVEAGKLLLVECTGFSLREDRKPKEPKKLSYAGAKQEAGEQMVKGKFLYALDISSLRRVKESWVTPLEFSHSPAGLRIIQEAHFLARQNRNREVGTPHLLYGFLADGAPRSREVFARSGVTDMDQARDITAGGLISRSPEDPIPTESYCSILDTARRRAQESNFGIVEEHHLLSAFLECKSSRSIDRALEAIGIDRQRVKKALDDYLRERGLKPEEGIDTYSSNTIFTDFSPM